MKIYKKLFFVIGCLILSITLIVSIQTYAKYLTSATGNESISIAKWNVSVNNLSIKNNSDISSTIQPVFPGNENVAPGIIAPNAEGYFDLNMDFTNVDVSFNYNILISPSEQSNVKDFVATGYSIDNGEKINFTNSSSISKDVDYSTKPTSQKIRVYIKWIDDSTSTMDDVADTKAATLDNQKALLTVILSFKQI
jgi:hypothetical protein